MFPGRFSRLNAPKSFDLDDDDLAITPFTGVRPRSRSRSRSSEEGWEEEIEVPKRPIPKRELFGKKDFFKFKKKVSEYNKYGITGTPHNDLAREAWRITGGGQQKDREYITQRAFEENPDTPRTQELIRMAFMIVNGLDEDSDFSENEKKKNPDAYWAGFEKREKAEKERLKREKAEKERLRRIKEGLITEEEEEEEKLEERRREAERQGEAPPAEYTARARPPPMSPKDAEELRKNFKIDPKGMLQIANLSVELLDRLLQAHNEHQSVGGKKLIRKERDDFVRKVSLHIHPDKVASNYPGNTIFKDKAEQLFAHFHFQAELHGLNKGRQTRRNTSKKNKKTTKKKKKTTQKKKTTTKKGKNQKTTQKKSSQKQNAKK